MTQQSGSRVLKEVLMTELRCSAHLCPLTQSDMTPTWMETWDHGNIFIQNCTNLNVMNVGLNVECYVGKEKLVKGYLGTD